MRIADLPIDVRGVIFDLDGTLFDSMPYWENLGEDYLRSRGKTPAPDIRAQFKRRTLEGSAAYMKEAYSLEEPVEEVIFGIVAGIERPYRELIPLKPGVREMLDALDDNGIPMGIATATDYDLARAALERLGVWNRFGFLHTCGTVGSDKNDPRIFNLSRERLGTPLSQTVVMEDSLHAIETAKRAGFPIIGVLDPAAKREREQIIQLSDATIASFVGLF